MNFIVLEFNNGAGNCFDLIKCAHEKRIHIEFRKGLQIVEVKVNLMEA